MPPVPRIKRRDGATAPASEVPNAQKPVEKKMEVIWDLPATPVTQREAYKPVQDGQVEPLIRLSESSDNTPPALER
jgi:hypothetical protein